MHDGSEMRSAAAGEAAFRLAVPEGCAGLRILATTDLHGHLTGFDYGADRARPAQGLDLLGSLIARLRAVEVPVLFVDNGDLVQGTPLSEREIGSAAHPMVAALTLLGCNAATLGNHEFNYGLESLAGLYRGAGFPLVLANVTGLEGVLPEVVLSAGALRVGVFGLVPPEILLWDGALLGGRIAVTEMAEAARQAVARLRGRCDLVLCLAHTGLAEGQPGCGSEAMGEALAEIEGLDLLVLGHSHRPFPPPGALLAGKPAVLAGHGAAQLGVIDLVAQPGPAGQGAKIIASDVRLLAPHADEAPLPAIAALAAPLHQRTRAALAEGVAPLPFRIASWFDRIAPGPALALTAAAARRAVMAGLGGKTGGLPLLAQAAPFRTGGRGGAENYLDISDPWLCERHLYDLAPFPNPPCALRLTGAALRHWLESAARQFTTLTAGEERPLLEPSVPGYMADTLYGLSYRLDLSAPPGNRLRSLTCQGAPVADSAEFLVASNTYRAATLGDLAEVIWVSPQPGRDALRDHLPPLETLPRADWGLTPIPGARALFDTSPNARADLSPVAALRPEPLGLTPEGFLSLRLHF